MRIPRSTGFAVNLLLFALVIALSPLRGKQRDAPAGIQKISHVVFLIKENPHTP